MHIYFGAILMISPLFLFHGTSIQNTSCVDDYKAAAVVDTETYSTTQESMYEGGEVAWLPNSYCLVIANTDGLWIYDVAQPEIWVKLVDTVGRTIQTIAINPADLSIAYSVTQEPVIYIINPDGTLSNIQVTGEAITDISFSTDGLLMAIASSEINADFDFYENAQVQIWSLSETAEIANIVTTTGAINESTFTSDNQHILIDGYRMGISGHDIEYWSIASATKIWNYYDLLRKTTMTVNDPLLPQLVDLSGDTLAVGGLYGYMDYDEYLGNGIDLWDIQSEKRLIQIVVNSDDEIDRGLYLTAMAFNTAGSVLTSSLATGTIQFWNVQDGSKQTEFEINQHEIIQLAFSSDDKFLAILASNKLIIWDNEAMREIATDFEDANKVSIP